MTESQKLDLLLSEITTIKNTMATKDDLVAMEHSILNACLGYTDEQDESIIDKLNTLQHSVNVVSKLKTIDNDVYNLVNKRIDELADRIDKLEKIS